mgnify:CR=1 FL=1
MRFLSVFYYLRVHVDAGARFVHVTTRNDKVKVVTFEQINDVVSWLYKPDQRRIFVVGQHDF